MANYHPVYMVWYNMHRRCYKPDFHSYQHYGAVGIVVVPEWHNFRTFAADVGERPSGHTLDRIDCKGPYSKINCRWATPKEQANNRKNSYLLTHRGETLTVSQWADKLGIKYCTLKARVAIMGWDVESALTLK